MAATRTRTPRTGRPREKSGTHKAIMFRFPTPFVEQLHGIAAEEERSINTAVFRLLREALKARGEEIAVPEGAINTRYAAS